jgi:hypothetical protein
MAEFPKVDRLKSQLITSGLQQKDPALFQIINTLIDFVRQGYATTTEIVGASSGGGSGSAINSLTTDVVAVGPGAAVATIQPGVVTYAKIQDTIGADVLIGRGSPAGVVGELSLGNNLQIVGNNLEITTSGGGSGGGLSHNLLSITHPDTIPDSPIEGDLIYAGPGGPLSPATYIDGAILGPLDETFVGIRAGYMLGMPTDLIPPISGFAGVPVLTYAAPVIYNVWPTWDTLDVSIFAPLVEDFTGIRAGYNALVPGQTEPGPGNSGGYSVYPLAFVRPAVPEPPSSEGIWQRLPIGLTDKYLKVANGIPTWSDLPEPSYPWINIPYSAANYSAAGGTTPGWVVASGDVARFQYQQFPVTGSDNIRIAMYVKTTSVTGSGPTQLIINLPFSITGEFAQFISIRENNNSVTNTYAYYDSGISATQLYIEKIGALAFDTTANETYLSFEISATLA